MLLISGLGEQMVAWPAEFCAILADAGFYVIRFDNRDTGGSTKLDEKGLPDLNAAWRAYFSGEPINAPYTLGDMALTILIFGPIY
ncbi:MAG: hypothetical protein SWH61_00005 [Thermodesulfobacteriota bacterium]|nr:hypothetical protein [Thermodesulfobacteriota bacterium]